MFRSASSTSISEAVERLRSRDPILKQINLRNKSCTDVDLNDLVDCLLAHPDVVEHLYLGKNLLTDKTGLKLAQYVAASTTIEHLAISGNQFTEVTHLAMATALRVNTSLRKLSMYNYNSMISEPQIDAAFIDALRLNPNRAVNSEWYLSWRSSVFFDCDFWRLKAKAEELGHPSLQAMLAMRVFGP
jgi:Leucine-rich repeat (LRR) protein